MPRAVFEDEEPTRRALLPLLYPAQYFVADMLHELSFVEREMVESSGFDTPHAEVLFFRDRVVIESYPAEAGDDEPPRPALSVQKTRPLLLGWRAALERRRMGRTASSDERAPAPPREK